MRDSDRLLFTFPSLLAMRHKKELAQYTLPLHLVTPSSRRSQYDRLRIAMSIVQAIIKSFSDS
jgi:hypothetical protein